MAQYHFVVADTSNVDAMDDDYESEFFGVDETEESDNPFVNGIELNVVHLIWDALESKCAAMPQIDNNGCPTRYMCTSEDDEEATLAPSLSDEVTDDESMATTVEAVSLDTSVFLDTRQLQFVEPTR